MSDIDTDPVTHKVAIFGGTQLPARPGLIPGCARGRGRALAEAVVETGDRLVATARNPQALDDFAATGGERVAALQLDVTDEAAAQRAVATAVERFGQLDVVVNNAGYGDLEPIEDTSIEAFRAQIETNLFGTIIVTKAAIPLFREQRGGRFSQVGVEGFSEVLATEMAPFGVHVTIVKPGGFRTDFAGASTRISEGNPAYAGTVGRIAAMQRDYDGNQPGDPARAARAIIAVSAADDPPLRLVLGRDAYARAEKMDEARLAELRAWRETSVATDFP